MLIEVMRPHCYLSGCDDEGQENLWYDDSWGCQWKAEFVATFSESNTK